MDIDDDRDDRYWSPFRILNRIERKVDWLMTEANATQADIDALTSQVTTDDAQVQAAVQALQAEIATLQGQGVNVAGLQAAVAQLTTDASADTPAPPAPAGP